MRQKKKKKTPTKTNRKLCPENSKTNLQKSPKKKIDKRGD
jgi:hypothetical protein